SIHPVGIGQKLSTKVNVNIGTSMDFPQEENELKKVKISLKYGTDTLMDLSTGGDITKIRRMILKKALIPLGTVPVYQAAIKAIEQRNSIVNMTEDDIFSAIAGFKDVHLIRPLRIKGEGSSGRDIFIETWLEIVKSFFPRNRTPPRLISTTG
ncbi:unnamed protein product, partial [marine sediment metagenome]